jgi:hypothetical protein
MLKGPIKVEFDDVFAFGCFVVGEVTPVRDFDRSTKESPVQAVDKDSGQLLWSVDVIDADPEAREKTVRIKIAAPVQPVPPEAAPGVPFRPVVFDGLTVTPYVATTASGRGRLAFSMRAGGMRAPSAKSAPSRAA